MSPAISLVIPAYNEEQNIGSVVRGASHYFNNRALPYEIIVVDDGSTDTTVNEVEILSTTEPRIHIVTLGTNQGKGHAVNTGVLRAKGDIILWSDADGSTPIEEYDRFLEEFKKGADILIGSRYTTGSSIGIRQPWYRVALGRLGNVLIRKTLLPGIMDTQCGFKAMKREVAHTIFPKQTINRWGFDMEILVIAKLHGFRIKEIPVSWHDVTNRASRLRPIRDAHRTLRDLIAIKINTLRGIYS
ncbi:MAG: glycosyltransferase family 2 protein [bacterium]|nr:glycosyltransferase family 2 protein [bacterium]